MQDRPLQFFEQSGWPFRAHFGMKQISWKSRGAFLFHEEVLAKQSGFFQADR